MIIFSRDYLDEILIFICKVFLCFKDLLPIVCMIPMDIPKLLVCHHTELFEIFHEIGHEDISPSALSTQEV